MDWRDKTINQMRIMRGSGKYIFLIGLLILILSSCGYRLIGSTSLPFNSVTIRPVQNMTYEPLLEEKMHRNLSQEFITQGITVLAEGGDVEIVAIVTRFDLRAIGAVNDRVKEQMIEMSLDLMVIDNGKITDIKGMISPIKITFQSEGTVSEAVAQKDTAIEKACAEIAKEFASKVVMQYAK